MQYLYAPWREEYLGQKKDTCPFCDCANRLKSDEELKVIFRAKHCFGVMNHYPYTPGHFMVIPYIHEENIENLSYETWQEMSDFVRKSVKILKSDLGARGVNIGMNLGKEAGAGIAPHCHYHLVPRWAGDTNFITSIGQVRVCGNDIEKIYQKFLTAFAKLI